jgi:hypothetical protein
MEVRNTLKNEKISNQQHYVADTPPSLALGSPGRDLSHGS